MTEFVMLEDGLALAVEDSDLDKVAVFDPEGVPVLVAVADADLEMLMVAVVLGATVFEAEDDPETDEETDGGTDADRDADMKSQTN